MYDIDGSLFNVTVSAINVCVIHWRKLYCQTVFVHKSVIAVPYRKATWSQKILFV